MSVQQKVCFAALANKKNMLTVDHRTCVYILQFCVGVELKLSARQIGADIKASCVPLAGVASTVLQDSQNRFLPSPLVELKIFATWAVSAVNRLSCRGPLDAISQMRSTFKWRCKLSRASMQESQALLPTQSNVGGAWSRRKEKS